MMCKNLDEVRNNIDRIDNEIIRLIAERGGYVKQASGFKKDTDGVKAPKRVEEVIGKVKKLAKQYNVNPEMIECMYREMISSFINLEMDEFNSKSK